MDESIKRPPVPTVVQKGQFMFCIYAYRQLTKNEALYYLGQYLSQRRLKSIPKTGSAEMWVNVGYDE